MSLKAKQSKMAPPMTEGGDKPAKKKANKSKPHATNWGGYVLKLLKQVHPTMKISKQAMAVMVSCVEDTFERISAEAGNLHRRGDSKTLTTRDIQSAVRLVFPGELSRHAVSEGCKAVIAFKGGQEGDDEEDEDCCDREAEIGNFT
ncbi:unnamed protein product [Cladocopium goreaui]|uniref:Core Histone H2A/H2B/H3 domain-containing protein n=1 Tax=Cladocopium goreaui TaxID=2562237 RepID=A0A9P1DIX3_9DINO|nr:unnamed protein product [Cladocopium goreaui]